MNRFFGGTASRMEVYGLFVAAVVILGGSIGGAIVLTDDPPAQVQEASATPTVVTESTTTTMVVVDPPPISEVASASSEPIAMSTSTVSVPGLDDQQSATLLAMIEQRQREEREAAARAEWQAGHPVAQIRDVIYVGDECHYAGPNMMLRWVYLEPYPAPPGITVTVDFDGMVSTASPNKMSGDQFHKTFNRGMGESTEVSYSITTNGTAGPVQGTITARRVSCAEYVE